MSEVEISANRFLMYLFNIETIDDTYIYLINTYIYFYYLNILYTYVFKKRNEEGE